VDAGLCRLALLPERGLLNIGSSGIGRGYCLKEDFEFRQ